ncbi:unnamed protein product [Sphagnum balticum]
MARECPLNRRRWLQRGDRSPAIPTPGIGGSAGHGRLIQCADNTRIIHAQDHTPATMQRGLPEAAAAAEFPPWVGWARGRSQGRGQRRYVEGRREARGDEAGGLGAGERLCYLTTTLPGYLTTYIGQPSGCVASAPQCVARAPLTKIVTL